MAAEIETPEVERFVVGPDDSHHRIFVFYEDEEGEARSFLEVAVRMDTGVVDVTFKKRDWSAIVRSA